MVREGTVMTTINQHCNDIDKLLHEIEALLSNTVDCDYVGGNLKYLLSSVQVVREALYEFEEEFEESLQDNLEETA